MDDNRSDQSSSSSTAVQSKDGTSDLTKLVVLGLAIGVGFVMIRQLPDLRRYIKMKSM